MKLPGGKIRIAAVAIWAVIVVAKAMPTAAQRQGPTLPPAPAPVPSGVLKWKFRETSAPALGSDGTLYVGQGSVDDDGNPLPGKICAFNPDGTTKWTFEIAGQIFTPVIGGDGTIYAGSANYSVTTRSSSGGDLYAINPKGLQKWKFAVDPVQSTPVIGPDGTIYVSDITLYAVSPSGRKKWSLEGMTEPTIGSDGTIYTRSGSGLLYAVSPKGKERWKFQVPTDDTNGVIDPSEVAIGADGTIYAAFGDHNLYALNPNGTQKWKFGTGDEMFSPPVVGPDGTIYISSGDLYAINPNGIKKWVFSSPVGISASPAIGADGVIYIGDNDAGAATLHALNPAGREMWKFITGGTAHGVGFPVSTPVIGVDGTVYWVGSWDGILYAIRPPTGAASAPTPERRR
jgi:outer membrane protein assembly factor BamB